MFHLVFANINIFTLLPFPKQQIVPKALYDTRMCSNSISNYKKYGHDSEPVRRFLQICMRRICETDRNPG